jgi:hypothetical protein
MQIDLNADREMLDQADIAQNRPPHARRPWLHLLSAVLQLAGGKAELLRHAERPWASVTFSGSRHTIALSFAGQEAIATGELFIAALPDHEFNLPRQIVADASVVAVDHALSPEVRLTVEVELLLLED